MRITLRPLILLLISGFLLMLGYGLSNILLPVRMQSDGVSLDSIGLVLSMLPVGFLLGAYYSRTLLQRVGHIRTFAMCGSLTAVAILLSGLFPDPLILGGMRVVTGFCIACTNATLDGWLSHSATEKNRGKILAINQMMVMTALFSGQFLLNVAPVGDVTLFIICGILFSLSITPIVISQHKGPQLEDSPAMSLITVFKLSPLGVVSSFYCGVLYASLINMLPIFANNNGISGVELSIFMGSAIFGAILLQFPIAYLSDQFDRRKVMFSMVTTFILLCAVVPFLISMDMFIITLLAISLITGLVACLYPMSLSETFDKVLKEQILAAMSALLLIYATGSILGPYLASLAMSSQGNNALFVFMIVAASTLLIFIAIRMKQREALPVDEQESFVMQAPSSAVTELDPRTQYSASPFAANAEVEVAISLASENPAAAVNMAKALVLRDPSHATQLAAALSTIEQIDIGKLYGAITMAAPQLSVDIAQALITASPEQAEQLVEWITNEHPEQFTHIVVAIANSMPDNGISLMELAAGNTVAEYPNEVLEMTEEYMHNLSESLNEMRPVDRTAAASEQTATDLYNRMTGISPEQSAELALTVSEAFPESSNDVAEAYLHNLIESESEQLSTADATENIENAVNDYMSQIVETIPEHAVDVAITFIESVPEVASEMLEMLQDSDVIEVSELSSSIDGRPEENLL